MPVYLLCYLCIVMENIAADNNPQIIRVDDFRIDSDYLAWFSEIRQRYLSAQIKASVCIFQPRELEKNYTNLVENCKQKLIRLL